jgi:VCPO second helical-bundle domain
MRRKTCKVQTLVTASLVLASFTTVNPARADAAVDWNIIASQAVGAGARAGGAAGLDFAMVHAAIHDAVQAYDGRFEPYAIAIQGAAGSPVAATAKAAHDVLVNRFPAQAASLDTAYQSYLANNGLAEDNPGVSVGQIAAAAIIALRANDGSYPANPEIFVGGTAPGEWRPTPPAFAPMAVPWLGSVTPFTLKDPTQFGAPPPPELISGRYTQDYDEVKAMGALVNSARTPEQTDLAYFFADHAFLYWNRAIQGLANAHLNNLGDSARLFALCNLAMADAPIVAWNTKKYYNFWRPVTAIREGDNDGNPRTAGDPAWMSLIANPAYPDYTSGANSLSGSTTRMLESFFGTDEVTFSMTSNFPLAVQKTRTYSRFSDAAQDVVDARVLLGIHFRFADEVARRQGMQVSDWAFNHVLRPLDEDDN